MTIATDIQGLKKIIGTSFGNYHEIVSDEKSVHCQARWPLLAQTQSILIGVTAVPAVPAFTSVTSVTSVLPSALQSRTQIHTRASKSVLAAAPAFGAATAGLVPAQQAIITTPTTTKTLVSTPVKLAIATGSRFAVKRRKQAVVAPLQSVKTSPVAATVPRLDAAKVSATFTLPVLTQVFASPATSIKRPISGNVTLVATGEATELTALFMRLEAPGTKPFAFSR